MLHIAGKIVDAAFEALRAYWDRLLAQWQVDTPDAHTNRMVNIWNAYQCMVTFNMSRSASYFETGIGRGMGFRDSNQDLLGFVHMVPERARQRILDIACGSNSSKAPAFVFVDTPFGEQRVPISHSQGYTAQFEPWFCRILLELGAEAVGIDLGDLDRELFTHYRVDLGQTGALNFLPERSFDAVQDSRLFGSPEFTAQFPNRADRLRVAREIRSQEQRLLKPGGIVIHSDAEALLRERGSE